MYKKLLNEVEIMQMKNDVPYINSGYIVEIEQLLIFNKNKIQKFKGLVMSVKKKKLLLYSIVIRKRTNSNEIVEKTFYLHSYNILKINIIKKYKFKKSKLFCINKINKYLQ